MKGKFAYMAPEQLQARELDRRADVWSLGVLLWETTLGRRLFAIAGEGATAVRVVQGPIPKPSSVAPGYPSALEGIIMSALDRDLERRTATAKQLADGLDQYLYGSGEIWGAAQVGEWMSEHFVDRRERRENMLSSAGRTFRGNDAPPDRRDAHHRP